MHSKITGHAMVRDLQIGLEVARTAVRRPIKIWTRNTDAALSPSRTAASDERPNVGHTVRLVVGALDAASGSTNPTAVRRLVHYEHGVARTSCVEVLPLADLMQSPFCHTHAHTPTSPPFNFTTITTTND